MKKLFVAAIAAATVLSANATSYVVLSADDLRADEVQIPCNYYEWEGTYTSEMVSDATAPDGGAHVRTLGGAGWFGGGWESIGAEFDFSTIAQGDYDLVFSLKSDLPESVGELWIQFNNTTKGKVVQPNLRNMIVLDNRWHTYRLNLRENFADVLNVTTAGDNLSCFTFGGTAVAGKKVELSDIRFEPKQEMPSISASASNITMTSAEINYTVTLPESLDGAEVEVLLDGNTTTASPIALNGLTAGTAYSHSLVARATIGGKTLESAPCPVSFSTLRDPSVTPVWYGLVEKMLESGVVTTPVPVTYTYELIANADNTLTANVTIEGYDKVTGAALPSFMAGGEWKDMTKTGDNTFTRTTEKTFSFGENCGELFFYLPFAGAADRTDVTGYTYGAANEPIVGSLKPRVTASAENIVFNAADIVYNVTLPVGLEGADVLVTVNGETATASPFAITGLTENTEYTYTVVATAALNGETYTSDEVKVSFKTPREGAVAISYWQITNGMMPNNYLVGEDESMRRKLPVSVKAEFVYNTDKTITINFQIFGADKIVGFVPEMNIGGAWSGSLAGKQNEQGIYTWTTPSTFEEGANLHSYCWFQFPGGVQGIDFRDFTIGNEQAEVNYGEAVNPVLTVGKDVVPAGLKVPVTAYMTDADGNYILDSAPEITLEDNTANATLEGFLLTLAGKGSVRVVATLGENSVEQTVTCLTSANAVNLAAGVMATVSEYATNDPALATDENEATQLEFNCAETQEHSIALDLGKSFDIEMIELVWEGASAVDYTVELRDEDAARAAAEPTVFTVTDGQGGAGVTPRKYLHTDNFATVAARYVTINTTRAFEPGWGIKLKEVRVFGTERQSSAIEGIEKVDTENSEARYFDLRGIEVPADALAPGLYIRLAGDKATKVVVK